MLTQLLKKHTAHIGFEVYIWELLEWNGWIDVNKESFLPFDHVFNRLHIMLHVERSKWPEFSHS